MKTLRSPVLTTLLAAFLLWAGSALSAQSVGHAHQHAHHHADTHTTTLCTWLCAAGQVMEGDSVQFTGPLLSPLPVGDWQSTQTPPLFVIVSSSRAPPLFL